MLNKNLKLNNRRIAILATDGFEESELLGPKKALEDAGAKVEIISLHPGKIRSWKNNEWGKIINVDKVVTNVTSANYDALVIPGGVMNPDRLRNDKRAVAFVKEFIKEGKNIASICHGPSVLIEAGLSKGKNITSWPSIKTDLINAGAVWVDKEVVVDGKLITSRSPADLIAFNQKIVENFAQP